MNWLVAENGELESAILTQQAGGTDWKLSASAEKLRVGRAPVSILAAEIGRGLALCSGDLYAGIELVEIPGVAELSEAQINADLAVLRSAHPNGVVLSRDLWHIPPERIKWVVAALEK